MSEPTTREAIKKHARRRLKGLLLEAYHEAHRAAAAGRLGARASGEWMERFEREAAEVIDETVDETVVAAHEAFKARATVKVVPDAKAVGDGKATLPMNSKPARTA